MKLHLNALCMVVGVMSAATTYAQTEVQEYRPGVTLEGITYCLPRTALRIVVTATRTDYTPGSLQPYAKRYMSMTDVPAEAQTTWTLDKVEVQPYGVADTTKFFSIALKSKTVAPLVSLATDGRLLAVNAEEEEKALPPVPQGVEGKNTLKPRDYMTREMLNSGSMAKQAELVAQEIYDIRESRSALSRGEAENMPSDGAQLKLMFDMLQTQETALGALFSGTTTTSTAVMVMNVVPEKGGRDILFRFSRNLGVVDADDMAGEPVYLSITPQGDLPSAVDDPSVAKKKAKAEKSIRYNVPMRTRIDVASARQKYADVELPMAQFGKVELLGEALFGKGAKTVVTFNPATGGIVNLSENAE